MVHSKITFNVVPGTPQTEVREILNWVHGKASDEFEDVFSGDIEYNMTFTGNTLLIEAFPEKFLIGIAYNISIHNNGWKFSPKTPIKGWKWIDKLYEKYSQEKT